MRLPQVQSLDDRCVMRGDSRWNEVCLTQTRPLLPPHPFHIRALSVSLEKVPEGKGRERAETLKGPKVAPPAQEPSREERKGFSRPQSKTQSNSTEPRTLVCPAATSTQGNGSSQGVEGGLGDGQ